MNTEISILNDAELDVVNGGMDPNYKECVNGTTAGGPAGTYPSSADCSEGAVIDLINAFHKGIRQGSGGGKPK